MTQNYPSYPEGQSGQYEYRPVEKGSAPSQVRTAVSLMLLRCVIGLISIIVLFATKNTLKNKIIKDNPQDSAHRINTALNAILAVGTVIAVIFLVFYALLAWQVSKGTNWARIVTWVFGGLGILSALVSLGQDESGASHVIALVTGVLDVAIVVLLIVGGRGGYFRSTAPTDPTHGSYPPPAYPPPR